MFVCLFLILPFPYLPIPFPFLAGLALAVCQMYGTPENLNFCSEKQGQHQQCPMNKIFRIFNLLVGFILYQTFRHLNLNI